MDPNKKAKLEGHAADLVADLVAAEFRATKGWDPTIAAWFWSALGDVGAAASLEETLSMWRSRAEVFAYDAERILEAIKLKRMHMAWFWSALGDVGAAASLRYTLHVAKQSRSLRLDAERILEKERLKRLHMAWFWSALGDVGEVTAVRDYDLFGMFNEASPLKP